MPTAIEEGTHVCPPDHKHGATSTCYTLHRCRCVTSCRPAQAARHRTARRLQAYGRWDRAHQSSWHALTHVLVLSRFGYNQEQIARAAGISARTVYRIASGKAPTIFGRVHRAILSVEPTISDLDSSTRIPSTGSRRRVEALACLGWSIAAIADQMGITRAALSERVNTRETTVESHLQLAAVYERLWNTHPSAATLTEAGMITRTRRRAAREGWVPPMGWDDIDTDPAAPLADADADYVDVVLVDLAVHGHRVQLTTQERHLAVRQLHAAGHGDYLIADMLLVSDKTIARDRELLGLPANENPTPLIRKVAA